MKCPICKGTGEIEEPKSKRAGKVVDNRIMASLLKKEGYSFRQIQKFLGYKSVGAIQNLLKK